MPVFCTQRLGRRIVPELGRYNLDSICAHFGVRNTARHRALGDARATASVWIELLERARAELAIADVGELLDLQSSPIRRRRRRAARRR